MTSSMCRSDCYVELKRETLCVCNLLRSTDFQDGASQESLEVTRTVATLTRLQGSLCWGQTAAVAARTLAVAAAAHSSWAGEGLGGRPPGGSLLGGSLRTGVGHLGSLEGGTLHIHDFCEVLDRR